MNNSENTPNATKKRTTGRPRGKFQRNDTPPRTSKKLPPTHLRDGKIGRPKDLEESPENDKTLKIIPLGGLGEIGKNMYALEYMDEILIIDAGIMFPEEDMPGIDFLIPNTAYLEENVSKIQALLLTHGHTDHVGAIPYVQEKLGNPDIYTAELTRGMVLRRHSEFPHKPKLIIHLVKDGSVEKIGKYFSVEFFRVNHSIPDDLALFIETPVGNVVFSSDFKFDDKPLNEKPADVEKMKGFGEKGVHILMCESTGAEKPGHSLSESDIQENMETIFKEAEGMLVVGTFSSMINRIQQIITLSEKYGRKVIFDGFSLKTNVEISKELGYIKLAKGTEISIEQIDDFPRNKITVVATGAQGEGRASLMRIVNREHRHIQIHKKDSVIFSSSVIPGNERSIQRLKDMLYRAGVKVYHYNMMDIHTGGHGNQEDLKKFIGFMKPKYLFPVHGQYSMMVTLEQLGKEMGVIEGNSIIADNGSIVHFTKDRWWFDKKTAPANYIMVDGLGVGDIGNVVLRDRQALAEDGMFVIVVLIDGKTGKVFTSPDIISRGFIYLRESKELLLEVRKKVKFIIEKKAHSPGKINDTYIKDIIRDDIGKFLFQKTERRPMVLPVVIEV